MEAQRIPSTITPTLKKKPTTKQKTKRGDLCYEAVASISDKLPQWGVNAARLIHDSLSVSFWTAEMSPSLGVLSAAHWTCHYQTTARRSSVWSGPTQKRKIRRGGENTSDAFFFLPSARRAKLLSPIKNNNAGCCFFLFVQTENIENLHTLSPRSADTGVHCRLHLHHTQERKWR